MDALLSGERSEKEISAIIAEKAFGESALSILPALKSGRWPLLRADMSPVLMHAPTMPLTLLQKRWLKAVSLDERVALFGADFSFLDGVEPLFTPSDYRVYDKYGDGDDFSDEGYIARFRFLLSAVREKAPIKLNITNKQGKRVYGICLPQRLEYSEKDDKFRLITSGNRYLTTVNLARINSCSRYEGEARLASAPKEVKTETLTLKITDERNAAERVLLHFAHFEKRAEKLDKKHYLVHIKYDLSDESELVMRVLSFGPMVEVTAPERFRGQIIEKLKKQKSCGLK
jgi:hypothetical protein